jgi:hypothetical protein
MKTLSMFSLLLALAAGCMGGPAPVAGEGEAVAIAMADKACTARQTSCKSKFGFKYCDCNCDPCKDIAAFCDNDTNCDTQCGNYSCNQASDEVSGPDDQLVALPANDAAAANGI